MQKQPHSVIAIASPPLHGKTTLARAIQGIVPGSRVLDVDEIRREIHQQKSGDLLSPEEEKSVMVRAYEEMCSRASHVTKEDRLTILPATFSRAEFKEPLHSLVLRPELSVRIFYIQVASFDVIKERIHQRAKEGSASNIKTEEQYRWALTLPAPWWNGAEVTMLDGTMIPSALAGTVLSKL